MALQWKYSTDGISWDELAALYRVAPLGDKKASHLQTVFANSMFKCFVYENAKLIEASRGHRKIMLYAVPGRQALYKKFGFMRMKTAMGIFDNPKQQIELGYLSEA